MKPSTKQYRLWLKLQDAKRTGDTAKAIKLQIEMEKLVHEKQHGQPAG